MALARLCAGWVVVLVLGGILAGCGGGGKESPYTESLVVMQQGSKLRMAPAEFGGVVAELDLGTTLLAVPEEVEVVYDTAYAEVELTDGRTGFIERVFLGQPEEWQQVLDLRTLVQGQQPQGRGTLKARASLRLGPGTDSRTIDSLPGKTPFEMYRRVATMDGDTKKDIWYLVDVGDGQIGYLYTRQLDWDTPSGFPPHTRYRRSVVWREMGGVDDHPAYVVGSIGDGDLGCDFDWVEIYAWDPPTGAYGTMFTVADIRGVLPLDVQQIDGVWHFDIREITDDGIQVTRWSDTRPARVIKKWDEPPSLYLH